jgi:hypothetical protein
LISAKASKALTNSGYPISSPFRIKYYINIPKEFINKFIEIEFSTFIINLLETNNYTITKELYKWARELNILLLDINIIIKNYWENI